MQPSSSGVGSESSWCRGVSTSYIKRLGTARADNSKSASQKRRTFKGLEKTKDRGSTIDNGIEKIEACTKGQYDRVLTQIEGEYKGKKGMEQERGRSKNKWG